MCHPHLALPRPPTRPSALMTMAPKYPPFLHGARGPDALLLSLSTVAANPAGLLRPWAKGYSKVISTALIEQIGQPSIAARPRHCHRPPDNFDFVCQIPATYRDLYPIRFCATLSESLLENRKTKKKQALRLASAMYHQRTTIQHSYCTVLAQV